MKRWAFLFIFFLFVCVFVFNLYSVPASAQEAASSISPSYTIAGLQYEAYPEFSRIIIATNENVECMVYELSDPYRVMIDFVGVSFCRLMEHVDYSEGLVKSVDIVKAPYVQRPEGIDSSFYAIDAITITPTSRVVFDIEKSEDNKIITIDFKVRKQPKLFVSTARPIVHSMMEKTLSEAENKAKQEPQQAEKSAKETAKQKALDEAQAAALSANRIVDYIYYEAGEDSSTLAVASKSLLEFEVTQKFYPQFEIQLRPKGPVFTDLAESVEVNDQYVRSITIVQDKKVKPVAPLAENFYAIDHISITLPRELPFDLYSEDEKKLSVVEFHYPKATQVEAAAGQEIAQAGPTAEKVSPIKRVDVNVKLDQDVQKALIQELKEDIKEERLTDEEVIADLKRQELENRKFGAEYKAHDLGRELLEDLVVRGKGFLSLSEAQDVTFKNSPDIKTLKEEVKVAKLKKREALRALFPNVKAKVSHTTGQVIDTDFIEEIYGFEMDHALFQSGKLQNTYKQSKMNLKVAVSRFEKVENETNFKVAEAYYNVVTAIMNAGIQKDLLQEISKIAEQAERRYAAGLSNNVEILNVRSRHNQVKFQIATTERDLALARFKLKQVMNLDIAKEDIDIQEVDTVLPFKVIDVKLEECLQVAAENHPDIKTNRLLVESNRYGEKVAKSKNGLKVDLTGFLGKSDSYYETEPRNLHNDWRIGLKFTKPLGPHTANYSYSKEYTGAKVGVTDREGSTVNAGEVQLFDKETYGAASDIREAKVSRLKAENDLLESRRSIEREIKEAYYSYQESIMQVKNAIEQEHFQEETVRSTRVQAGYNEAMQSQLVDAMVKLADDKSLYVKALSDYNLALVKLNKAVGVKDYFRAN